METLTIKILAKMKKMASPKKAEQGAKKKK